MPMKAGITTRVLLIAVGLLLLANVVVMLAGQRGQPAQAQAPDAVVGMAAISHHDNIYVFKVHANGDMDCKNLAGSPGDGRVW